VAVIPDATEGRGGAGASPRLAARPDEVPVRAEGVQLMGEMLGSGYREPPALIRRSDGQTIQLTPLLYQVLDAVDGQRNHEEIAAHVSAKFGRLVSAENVQTLIDSKLRPLGVLELADGSQPELKRSNPLLGLRFRYAVTDPDKTRQLTGPFARLFHPLVVLPVIAAFLAVCWWVLMDKGLASATYEAFQQPGLLLLIFAVTVLSAGFHEFGHAAAARYGGATPGVMGAGVYLVWPAFYTDVTDSYRLGRGGRVRTDLGGLYFNAIVAVGIVGIWWATGYDALLLIVVTQILQMVRQLAPLVRFDGYHVLADLTGVPDLFQRIKPTLLGMLPWNWRKPESRVLKPWARAVVTVWVVLVVPLLLICLLLMVMAFPRLLATAWVSLADQQAMLTDSFGDGDMLSVAARVLAILAIAFPVLGIIYILTRLVRQVVGSVWRRTAGRPLMRRMAVAVGAAIVVGLAWAWWPNPDTYRPVQPYERGTLVDVVASVSPAPTRLSDGQSGTLQTIWPADAALPTADKPALAMVLVPRAGDDRAPAEAPGWVFPFSQPLLPGEGDNQALAVNTEDGSVLYDVAFALVWADGDEPVDNSNEALAYASCTDCTTVAVSFQVVLVIGEADVVVPENSAEAINYNCAECVTAAVANQLVITLDGPLSEEGMAELEALWAEIAAFGENLEGLSIEEIEAQLAEYEAQIIEIIEEDSAVAPAPEAGASTPPDPASTSDPVGTNAPEPSSGSTASTTGAPPAQTSTEGTSPTTDSSAPPPSSEPPTTTTP
jgi:putative peptide zinc metalloprotease protein